MLINTIRAVESKGEDKEIDKVNKEERGNK